MVQKQLMVPNIGAGDQTVDHPSAICFGINGELKAYLSSTEI